MSHPSESQLARLGQVSDELREVFAERGYRVDVAMEADPAFGSGSSRSAVTRDLAVDAVSSAASKVGIDFRPVNGNGRELRILEDGVDRRFRFLRARRRTDGVFRVEVNSDSALSSSVGDDPSIFVDEQWVFCWTKTAEGLIEDVFVAQVRGYVEGKPGHLILGPVIHTGRGDVPTGGFDPVDEGLEGFDDEGTDESGTSLG